VFSLTPDGITLEEVAPGIDPEKDILAQMDFKPRIVTPLKTMDVRIFQDRPMGLRETIEERKV